MPLVTNAAIKAIERGDKIITCYMACEHHTDGRLGVRTDHRVWSEIVTILVEKLQADPNGMAEGIISALINEMRQVGFDVVERRTDNGGYYLDVVTCATS